MAGKTKQSSLRPISSPIGSQAESNCGWPAVGVRRPVVSVRRGLSGDWRQVSPASLLYSATRWLLLQMAERRLSQPGMRRFLVDRRTRPDAGGSNQPQPTGLEERPHESPEPEPNMDNVASNFQELVDFLKDNNEEVRNAYDRAGLNCKMTSPDIQKDLARCCAEEITEAIMEEIGDRPFSVLIDESRDISVKEQMAVILRYVNSKGTVVERFLALVHVKETTADALKEALLAVLDRNKLSVSRMLPLLIAVILKVCPRK